jgi:HK97 gp10 family phage protein
VAKPAVKMVMFGDKDLRRLLEELPGRIIRKGLRQALTAMSTPILRAARAAAPRESGLLKKALGRKISAKNTGIGYAVIGAKKGVQGVVNGRKRVPSRYIHLVEKGHGGPHPVAAQPFLRPAYAAHKDQATAAAAAKLKSVLEAEAAKFWTQKAAR